MTLVKAFIFSYLIGSISGSISVSRIFFGEDIRQKGSGNAGGTNTVRIYGVKYGLITIFFDVFKATFVTYIANRFMGQDAMYMAGIGVVIGHIFPIYYGFKGGKGVATVFGANLYINLLAFSISLICFIILNFTTGIVAISSIISVFVAGVIALINTNNQIYIALAVLHFLIITFAHRANIKRIIEGKELKINLVEKIFKKK